MSIVRKNKPNIKQNWAAGEIKAQQSFENIPLSDVPTFQSCFLVLALY